MELLRYLWAGPNTLLGLLFVALALAARGRCSVRGGVLEVHGPPIAWALTRVVPLPCGADAVTLGHVVLGRTREALDATRAHERVHVRQYERWGLFFLPAYVLASLWSIACGTGLYTGNRFERQARDQAGGRVGRRPA